MDVSKECKAKIGQVLYVFAIATHVLCWSLGVLALWPAKPFRARSFTVGITLMLLASSGYAGTMGVTIGAVVVLLAFIGAVVIQWFILLTCGCLLAPLLSAIMHVAGAYTQMSDELWPHKAQIT